MNWKDYLILAGIVLAVVLVWSFWPSKDRDKVLRTLKLEREAIRAKGAAKKFEAELGREKAVTVIETRYKETLEELDEHERQKAADLRGNPSELGAFLVRASGRSVRRER